MTLTVLYINIILSAIFIIAGCNTTSKKRRDFFAKLFAISIIAMYASAILHLLSLVPQ